MAAAYAEAGDFANAIELQQQVVTDFQQRVVDNSQSELVAIWIVERRAESESRLKLYEAGQPYRDVPKTEVATTTVAK